jgi:thiol-disulfide isomerase/thioredoxin
MQAARRKALLLAGIGAAAAVAGGVAAALFMQAESGAARLLAMPLADLGGSTRRLVDFGGRVRVCNFWATWCAPCREEIPLLVAAQQQYGKRGLRVIGIAVDTASNVREFAAKYRITYPIFLAGAEAIDVMRATGNTTGGLPYTVVLDHAGRIVERRLGAYQAGELDRVLATRLG